MGSGNRPPGLFRAARPRITTFGTITNGTDIARQLGASTRKAVPDGTHPRLAGIGEAARPHLAATEAALSCEVQAKSGVAYNCSYRPITDLELL